jgi:hypothetical protein
MMDTEAENEVVDMRADFESAIESLDSGDELSGSDFAHEDDIESPIESLDAVSDSPEAKSATGEAVSDSSDSPEAKSEAVSESPDAKSATSEAKGATSEAVSETPDAAKKATAPIGWGAEAREAWAGMPDSVKQTITAREREIATTLQRTSEERRAAHGFTDAIAPFRETLQQQYADPFTAVKEIVGAAASMQSGSPQQRAAATAKVISDLGIDIRELDSALSGQPNQQPQAPAMSPDIQRMLDERLKPFDNMMAQQRDDQQNQRYQTQQKASQDVNVFSQQAEFISDVREEMADLLDMSAKRGMEMTLQQAYDKACMFNPQVSAVLQQRTEASRADTRKQELDGKRLAASSVSGGQGGSPQSQAGDTVESALRDAWAQHT